MNVIEILRKDHAQVNRLFHLLENSSRPEKLKVLEKIVHKLDAHVALERNAFEQILEGQAEIEGLEDQFREFIMEFEAARQMVASGFSSEQPLDAFQAGVDELKDAVEKHVEEMENEFFPEIRKHVGSARLEQIGQLIEQNSPPSKGTQAA